MIIDAAFTPSSPPRRCLIILSFDDTRQFYDACATLVSPPAASTPSLTPRYAATS